MSTEAKTLRDLIHEAKGDRSYEDLETASGFDRLKPGVSRTGLSAHRWYQYSTNPFPPGLWANPKSVTHLARAVSRGLGIPIEDVLDVLDREWDEGAH